MNVFISAEIAQMIAYSNVFEQNCKLAAIKDDGVIDKQEEKILNQVHSATQKYIQKLNKIIK